ncbi:hypothetical protein C7I84_08080 [Mesorhizobium ephedrae]|uniref:Lytic murein transglycosylase n=1 Tax=Kumtagia ephedrae TaxID=2116701 RepID=A0A2P7SJA2_9HYPH|nr:hypothetical protein C7I84_08080 [Mesorhizobium ephedrae]
MALLRTPLCPAGHLPRKGGDWPLPPRRSSCNASDWRNQNCWPISPLAGEMSGPFDRLRTEGGAKERGLSEFARRQDWTRP